MNLLMKVPKHTKKMNAKKDSQQAQKLEFTPIEMGIIKQSENDFKMCVFNILKDVQKE